jgi:hypothetical protein
MQMAIQGLPVQVRKGLLVPNFLNQIFNLENAQSTDHVDTGDSSRYFTHVYCFMSEDGTGGNLNLTGARIQFQLYHGDCLKGLFSVLRHNNEPIQSGHRISFILAFNEDLMRLRYR